MTENQPEKHCSKCLTYKPTSEFRKRAASKDGLQRMCKACSKRYNQHRYRQKQDQIIAQNTKWNLDNKKKTRKYVKKYKNKIKKQPPKTETGDSLGNS